MEPESTKDGKPLDGATQPETQELDYKAEYEKVRANYENSEVQGTR
jgi:hypothetical protein